MSSMRYRGRNPDRVRMFLSAASAFKEVGASFVIDGKLVYKDGETFATYSWLGDSDIPEFILEPAFVNVEQDVKEGINFVMEVEHLLGREPWSESAHLERQAGNNVLAFVGSNHVLAT